MAHTHYPGHAAQPGLPTVSYVTIDHLSGTPVYVQLAGILRAQIEAGEIEPDRPLPSYTTLMQEHGIARGTAAKAVQVLVDEGLVRIVPGRGAYVVERR
jgi:DNA-binding GntR family transcriptional regulator